MLAALLCFAGAYLSNRYGQAPGVLLRTDADRLQKLLRTAELTAEQEAAEITAEAQRGELNFGRLVSQTTYPCFVYRNEQLLYWSDHTTRPEPEHVGQSFTEKLVTMQFGHYIALRHAAGPYVVLTYVPLEKGYGISNRYLRDGSEKALFRGLNVRLVTGRQRPDRPKFYSDEGSYLFSLESLQLNPATGKRLPMALMMLGFGFYLGCWLLWAWQLARANSVLAGAAVLLLPLVLLRAVLLHFGLPFSFIELPLFDPRVYAASWLSPSLGDLFINALLLAVGAYYAQLLFRRYNPMRWVERLRSSGQRTAVATVAGVLFFLLLELLFQFYSNSFNNSQIILDITQDISVSGFKLLLCLAIVLHTGSYLVGFYMLAQLFSAAVLPETKRGSIFGLGLSALLFLPIGIALGQVHVLLVGITLWFLLLLRLMGLRRVAAVVPYQVYLFIFLMLGISSAVGALALFEHFDRQLVINKQTLAGNLLVDNDLQGEFLLTERTREMAADPLIRTLLASPFASSEVVRQKIVKHYLRDYFDKYEIAVSLFDPAGRPLGAGPGAESLSDARSRLLKNATRTDQLNLFLVRGSNSFSTRRYVDFVAVPAPVSGSSTVLLELTLKKLTNYSVVPELLIDQKFFQPGLGAELSYAGFEKDRLVYNEGDFDYVNRLLPHQYNDPRLYRTGLVAGRYHHLAVRDEAQHRTVVVTTDNYSFTDWLANFSFLFLLHTFFWLLSIGLYLLVRGEYLEIFRTNFSTKIQLFLNFGILVPLVIVSIATASQVTSSYKRDLRRTYERRGRAVQENLLQNRALLADSMGRAALFELADNVSSLTETDLNLYDASGELLVSSQPIIFESGLLGTLMNPQAVAALKEHTQPRVLLTERAGSLSFNALYLPLRAPEAEAGQAGRVLGYVGIPFFDSEKELDNKLIELISTLVNIFTVMFIFFLILTFVASRVLTDPLKLLTEKLKQTTLTGQNEMLDYQSNDEIGLLVREYNAMLLKLEESKQELAAQEKEAAWREMARQVAHEIKNPLTPMKLSLQFLQRAIQDNRPNIQELIGKVSQTLITQIDVLTDIATSFSNFTNLPAMRPERLDVAQVLRRCVELHQGSRQDARIRLQLPAEETPATVFADESLLVRTFNNLLINALQSVPEGRGAEIEAQLEIRPEGRVRISIQDNGAGIAEEVREKVFVPNFTTKATGSGIGLAVAKRGIESAGGSIWFETEEGTGTTFYIELPLAG
ncbi:HAMP domain-containing histidine kinase [Microvirga sp. STR05]|uniref:histidine kinase n=1 Tax=Hymenobacter duratus TaxID=2771356 RepID=A0ABR8JGW5_9BACT|nr:HAMP domain-containing sensor histidine kinase [Hymenobacter duratus]MBD2714828.1 HAMP domain-containing histidine kinase [Hymenobacter duratus]MBR7949733.1 HAMP domain-containing histidine kinase [Microvirga sp. STR05]